VKVADNKQYRRMNRQRFEEEADVKADAGSLWVMEGQGAYLFSQNQMRMVGDLLNVKIEGAPRSQLQTKTKVISSLLARLEAPQQRGLASTGAAPAPGAPAAAPAADPAAAGKADEAAAKPGDAPKNDGPFNVTVVPTRIIEQLKDGSYRVRGMQPFMIGKREYKVIVTGVVRPEDFDDAGIEAAKLLDPQFDIVSSRKGMM
jgi:flagellar L-ring protein precursor FlgH